MTGVFESLSTVAPLQTVDSVYFGVGGKPTIVRHHQVRQLFAFGRPVPTRVSYQLNPTATVHAAQPGSSVIKEIHTTVARRSLQVLAIKNHACVDGGKDEIS